MTALATLSAHAAGAPTDLDGDGKSDILWRNAATGENYSYFMNALSIVNEGYLRTIADQDWQLAGAGDFDGDGRVDILWRNAATGENYVYFMNGVSIVNEGYVRSVTDHSWQVAGVGDFDGDGKADILWRNTVSGENYVYFMNGVSIVNEGYLRTVATGWRIKGVADFDGDGKADILWRHNTTDENYLYLMNGLSIANEGYLRTVAAPWQIKGVADFNGDGMADILWRNTATGENYLYLMHGVNIVAEGYVRTVADLNWQVAALGDYDGDGKSDILWRNASTGENYLYPMDGTAIKPTERYIRAVPDLAWRPTPGAPDIAAPSTPTALVATPVSDSRINLVWSASTDDVAVTGYRVIRNGSLLTIVGKVTTFQDTGLSPVTNYTYRLRALDAAANLSPQSTLVNATTLAIADTVAPTTPTGLAASPVSATRIALSWTPSTDNVAVTGYRVYRNGVLLVTLGNVTAYENSLLVPSTTYSYRVDAIDAAGNASGQSTAAGATTMAITTATLAWDAAAGNLSGYRVYFGTTPGTYLQPKGSGLPVAANVTTLTVPGLNRGIRYYFAVTAFDANNESDYSTPVFKDIP